MYHFPRNVSDCALTSTENGMQKLKAAANIRLDDVYHRLKLFSLGGKLKVQSL